jgi:hypothetical protein
MPFDESATTCVRCGDDYIRSNRYLGYYCKDCRIELQADSGE